MPADPRDRRPDPAPAGALRAAPAPAGWDSRPPPASSGRYPSRSRRTGRAFPPRWSLPPSAGPPAPPRPGTRPRRAPWARSVPRRWRAARFPRTTGPPAGYGCGAPTRPRTTPRRPPAAPPRGRSARRTPSGHPDRERARDHDLQRQRHQPQGERRAIRFVEPPIHDLLDRRLLEPVDLGEHVAQRLGVGGAEVAPAGHRGDLGHQRLVGLDRHHLVAQALETLPRGHRGLPPLAHPDDVEDRKSVV